MKIYTKTGDKGETGLFGGRRLSKDELRIEAYGTVDELNSMLGLARSFNDNAEVEEILGKIQVGLFVLGADLATPPDVKESPAGRIAPGDFEELERIIDSLEARLTPLTNFILPGGSKPASFIHTARTVCRRAERKVVSLRKKGQVSEDVLIYLNRLSDLLFVLARFANKVTNHEETPWAPRDK